MKITYLYNSGFKIETDKKIIVFDAMTDPEINFSNDKKTYFFVTHFHDDHYNNLIFNYDDKNTRYILSDDIPVHKSDNIFIVKSYDEITVDDIKIKVFSSTDLGVSFLIMTEDILMFHSGDLNWWHWADNTEAKQRHEAFAYKSEIIKLKEYIGSRAIDISFIPVDPKLENAAGYALDYYLSQIKTNVVFPVHFMRNYSYLKELDRIITKYPDVNIIRITEENELFKI